MFLIESVTVCQWQRNRSTIAGVLGTLQCSFSALLPLDSWSSYPLLPVNRKMVHLSPSVSGSHFTFKTRSFTCQLLRKITVPFLLTIFLGLFPFNKQGPISKSWSKATQLLLIALLGNYQAVLWVNMKYSPISPPWPQLSTKVPCGGLGSLLWKLYPDNRKEKDS